MSSSDGENPGNPLYEWLESNGLESIYSKFDEADINLDKSHLVDIDPNDLNSLCNELQLSTEERIKFKKIVKNLNNNTRSIHNNSHISHTNPTYARTGHNVNNNNNTVNTSHISHNNSHNIHSVPKQIKSPQSAPRHPPPRRINQRINGHGSRIDYKLKIVLVGDSATGKTSLIQKYVKNEFQNDYVSTIGIDFGTKVIITPDNELAQLQIWDTCGQERFDSVSMQYFRGAHCVIIVYDIMEKKSFKCIEDRWINTIRDNVNSNAFIIIVGNKLDKRIQFEKELNRLKSYTNTNTNTSTSNGYKMMKNGYNKQNENITRDDRDKDNNTQQQQKQHVTDGGDYGDDDNNEQFVESKSAETSEDVGDRSDNNIETRGSSNTTNEADMETRGNESDEEDEEENDMDDNIKEEMERINEIKKKFVTSEEGLELAQKYNFTFCEASAKSGRHIDSIFLMCAVSALAKKDELGIINLNQNNNNNDRNQNGHREGGGRNNNINLNQRNQQQQKGFIEEFCGC